MSITTIIKNALGRPLTSEQARQAHGEALDALRGAEGKAVDADTTEAWQTVEQARRDVTAAEVRLRHTIEREQREQAEAAAAERKRDLARVEDLRAVNHRGWRELPEVQRLIELRVELRRAEVALEATARELGNNHNEANRLARKHGVPELGHLSMPAPYQVHGRIEAAVRERLAVEGLPRPGRNMATG